MNNQRIAGSAPTLHMQVAPAARRGDGVAAVDRARCSDVRRARRWSVVCRPGYEPCLIVATTPTASLELAIAAVDLADTNCRNVREHDRGFGTDVARPR
jgi:hypothetical protein